MLYDVEQTVQSPWARFCSGYKEQITKVNWEEGGRFAAFLTMAAIGLVGAVGFVVGLIVFLVSLGPAA